MAAHAPHFDGVIDGRVLFDGCPRCAEYADDPNRMDDASLLALMGRVNQGTTECEARALAHIGRARGLAMRLEALGTPSYAGGTVRMGFDG